MRHRSYEERNAPATLHFPPGCRTFTRPEHTAWAKDCYAMKRIPVFRRYFRAEVDGAALEILPAIRALWLTWYGSLTPKEYEYILNRLLETLVENRYITMLVDSELQTYIDPRSNEWEMDKLHPELYASGLRLAAIRPSNSMINKMDLEEINETLGHGVYDAYNYEVRFFATMDEALARAVEVAGPAG